MLTFIKIVSFSVLCSYASKTHPVFVWAYNSFILWALIPFWYHIYLFTLLLMDNRVVKDFCLSSQQFRTPKRGRWGWEGSIPPYTHCWREKQEFWSHRSGFEFRLTFKDAEGVHCHDCGDGLMCVDVCQNLLNCII